MTGLTFLGVFNGLLAFWNAYSAAKGWVESKATGGYPWFMAWIGAIMSALGFTWLYLEIVVYVAYSTELLTAQYAQIALQIGQIILWPGIIISLFMISVHSWARTFRDGGVLDYSSSVYNTYAQYHNTNAAIHSYGNALSSVVDFMGSMGGSSSSSSSDDDNGGAGAVMLFFLFLILAVLALSAGITTTALIIKKFSATDPLPSLDELRERRLVVN